MLRVRSSLVVLLVVLGAGLVPASATAGPPESTGARAMWVWDRPGVASLVTFAEDQGVADLFVATPFDLANHPSLGWYRALRTEADAAGIRLHALGSETTWIDDPAAARSWQRSSLGTGLFDGVHLDVEPWLHPDWVTARDRVVAGYLEVLAQVTGGTDLPVEADIAFWLHTVPTADGGRLDRAVLARVDAVTVMSYRDTATGTDSITDVGGTALAAAADAGRPARLAAETNHLGTDPVAQKQTFHGSTRRAMASVLAAVDEAVAGHPAYAGIAVHDRAGWRAMRR